jgi:hypothetical protein
MMDDFDNRPQVKYCRIFFPRIIFKEQNCRGIFIHLIHRYSLFKLNFHNSLYLSLCLYATLNRFSKLKGPGSLKKCKNSTDW